VLVGELGIEPSPALRDLEAAILRQDERLAAPERARRYRTNLPLGATALVGREAELGEAGAILRDRNVRLLTLTGPGGIGKTRLALALALALAHATRDGDETPWFSDGACWVPLAALRDPSLVLPTIAGVLEIESAQSSTADALVQFLAGGRLLLVLDNAEHLLPEIALELAPLQQVDGPTLLVTSRERLHLSGEHVYPVPPLAQQEAVALFLARAAQHGASVSAESAVEELCARLDRLPLALELAAARTPVFSPSQLLDRLGRALDLLTGERDTDSRQQTLRASIAWSHDLLDEAEKRLFAYMSVFAGGCTIEAAEQVCATDIDTLASLVDKSLVRRASSDAVAEPRFWMLETIREYAAERLESRGEAIELRRRHAAHFLALAEQADPELWGPRQRAWFDRLAVEHDNMRAALAWGIAAREPELAIRLIGALEPFWEARGHVAEARGWFADARAAGIEASPGAYAKALYGISRLAGLQGDRIEERELLEHAIRLAREAGTTRELILALAHLGNALEPAGDADRARELHTESVAIARTDGDPWALALALNNFGYWLGVHGEPEAARPLVEESLELRRALGEQRGIAITLTTLGELAIGEGNYEAATAQLEESLALAAEIGNRHLEALSACELGLIAVYRQQQAKAYEHLVRGLDLSGELGFAGDAAIGLAAVAALAAGEGDTDRAARLWGASEALFEETGTGGEPQLRELMERILPEARSSGDEAAFGRALEAGRRLSLVDAVAYALEPHAPG
jgi:predicted ATPase